VFCLLKIAIRLAGVEVELHELDNANVIFGHSGAIMCSRWGIGEENTALKGGLHACSGSGGP